MQSMQPETVAETSRRPTGIGAKIGAGVLNVVYVPGKAITCTAGTLVAGAFMLATFGTAYREAVSFFNDGCRGSWVLTPERWRRCRRGRSSSTRGATPDVRRAVSRTTRWAAPLLFSVLLAGFAAGLSGSYREIFPAKGLHRITGIFQSRAGDTLILVGHDAVAGLMEEMPSIA